MSSTDARDLRANDQHKKPLTVKEIFQDVPADHAFKTMTMEAFPHSGTQLASVHPCKHASVMKKFIDRMEESTAEAPPSKDAKDKDKRRWLPGVMRKVTGSDKKGASGGSTPHGDEDAGVQVDFYLVIVSAGPSSEAARPSCEARRKQGCSSCGCGCKAVGRAARLSAELRGFGTSEHPAHRPAGRPHHSFS